MRKNKPIYDNLNINIFTIGYTPEGESIVFIIWSGKDILYTGVIDSYERNNINQTKKLLDDLNISRIDMLCWSHPDYDHSVGLEKLFDYLDEKSVFVIPSNVVEYRDKIEHRYKAIWDFISKEQLISSSQRKNGYKPIKCEIQYIADSTSVCNLPCTSFSKGASIYEFSLKSFLPKSRYTYRGEFNEKCMEVNGFSVGVVLQLGEFCAVFASDCHDNYIKKIDSIQFTEYCDFLKIPHHGSKTSTEIINCFNSAFEKEYKINVSTVTTKKASRLPASEAMEKYKAVCENIIYTDEMENGFEYGIGVVSVDVTDIENRYMYNFFGNAGLIK